jgi:hypothetical protein
MIIGNKEALDKLFNRMALELHIYTPIYSDLYYHEIENQILLVGITFKNGDTYIISKTHADAPTFEFIETTFSIESKSLVCANYERTGREIFLNEYYTPYTLDTHNLFGEISNVNRIIPIAVWTSIIKNYHNSLLPYIDFSNNFTYNSSKILRQIEKSGLAFDKEALLAKFGERILRSFKGDLLYSQYNLFTKTGRPSNRFGGINYAALNKNDGTRDIFVSRFKSGILVQMDFEAYHLRLIADYLQISLPFTSIHTELAKHYYNTHSISEEMYNESKRKTFNLLYGLQKNIYGIDLFDKIFEFRKEFKNKTSIVLPSGVKVDIGEENSNKLFNYFVQSLETVKTLPKLKKILEILEGKNAYLTMFTYDSILLDMEYFDDALIHRIKDVLEENIFPVRIYSGTTYGNLSLI